MAANDKIMEAIARIEHKVDLLLGSHPKDTLLAKVGDLNHYCPVCDQKVEYQVDIVDGVVLRKCGCKTGKIALDMGAFAPPVLPARKVEDNGGSEEDRSDTTRGDGRTRRR